MFASRREKKKKALAGWGGADSGSDPGSAIAFPSLGLRVLICEIHHFSSFFYGTHSLNEPSKA